MALYFGDQSVSLTSVNQGGSPLEVEQYNFNQMRDEVNNFITNVSYNPSDYTVSSIPNYVSTPSGNYPNGITIPIKENGHLILIDGNTKNKMEYDVSVGNHIIYNCTPGYTSQFFVINNNTKEIKQMGLITPTGQCRMIKAGSLIYNVRDLGGWACNGGTVRYGLLFRGGDLWGDQSNSNLTDDTKNLLLNFLKIRHEIDLRFEADMRGRFTESELGPSVDFTWVDFSWQSLSEQALTTHITDVMIPLMEGVVAGKPTYFHCSAGADRTGVIALLCNAVLGVSQSDLDKDYELTCFYTGVSTDAEARRRNETTWTREINFLNTFSGSTFAQKTANFLISCGVPLTLIENYRKAMINGTYSSLGLTQGTVSITNTFSSNITGTNMINAMDKYQAYKNSISAGNGSVIKKVIVKMGNTDITSSCWKGTNTVLRRSVSYNLIGCTSSNTTKKVIDGESYASKIIPDTGYTLEGANVEIKVGGIVMDGYWSDGIIAIPKVSDNLTITVEAVENTAPAYTNQLLNAINFNGEVIGKTPLYTNKRFNSSSGNPVDNPGTLITGLIPVKIGDTIRLRWPGKNENSYQCIKTYKADRTQCHTGYLNFYHIMQNTNGNTLVQGDLANGILDWTISASSVAYKDVAYIVIQIYASDLNSTIITVNEEITGEQQ